MTKEEDIYFLINKMHIDIDHLLNTLNSKDIISYKDNIVNQIHKYIRIVQNQKKRCDEINGLHIAINNMKANIVLDSIRLALLSFCRGGMHDLWVFQENQT